jgi:hypothetical protein
MCGCQLGSEYHIVHAKQDQTYPIHFNLATAVCWIVQPFLTDRAVDLNRAGRHLPKKRGKERILLG